MGALIVMHNCCIRTGGLMILFWRSYKSNLYRNKSANHVPPSVNLYAMVWSARLLLRQRCMGAGIMRVVGVAPDPGGNLRLWTNQKSLFLKKAENQSYRAIFFKNAEQSNRHPLAR